MKGIHTAGPATSTDIHEIHHEYVYRFDGRPEDLKVEEGEAQGFEAWAVADLLELPVDRRGQFVFDTIGQPFPDLFARINLYRHRQTAPRDQSARERVRAKRAQGPHLIGSVFGGEAMSEMLAAPYSAAQGYYFEDIDLPDLPESISIAGTNYSRIQHLHCSLIKLDSVVPGIVAGGKYSQDEAMQRAANVITTAIHDLRPHISRYRPEFRLASKPDLGRQTILIMANLEHNAEFQ
jgi:hypothetical protein